MSKHPTIAALKAALESERDTIVDKWKNSNGYYSEDRYIASGFNMRDMRSISSLSHEAATERLMSVLEQFIKSVELAIALIEEVDCENRTITEKEVLYHLLGTIQNLSDTTKQEGLK